MKALPVDLDVGDKGDGQEESAIRQIYSTSMLGPHVQLFVLDYRRGYLGREQVTWLTEALTNSSARFKVILSGTPFGVSTTRTREPGESFIVESGEVSAVAFAIQGGGEDIAGAAAQAAALVAASTATAGQPPATVSMQLPPPIVGLGWDESGRVNLSLAAVIAAYQLSCAKKKAASMEIEMETSRDDTMTYNEDITHHTQSHVQEPPKDISVDERTESTVNEIPRDSTIPELEIDSGIVILSAGSCVPYSAARPIPIVVEIIPEPKRRSVNSSAPISGVATPALPPPPVYAGPDWSKTDTEVGPFAASYDPGETGRAFCFELCVGGGVGVGGEHSVASRPVALPALGADLVFVAPISSEEGVCESYAAIAALSEDGYSLDLKLLGLRESQEHSLLFRQILRIPH